MIMDMQKNKAKWNQNVENQPGGAMGMTQQSVSYIAPRNPTVGKSSRSFWVIRLMQRSDRS